MVKRELREPLGQRDLLWIDEFQLMARPQYQVCLGVGT